MRSRAYIEELASNGRHQFSSVEAFQAIGGSKVAVRAQLRRLKEQGLIAEPARSFHVIVSPEYRRPGFSWDFEATLDAFLQKLVVLFAGEAAYLDRLRAGTEI